MPHIYKEEEVKLLGALALAGALLLSLLSPAAAKSVPIGHSASTILKTFRLQVSGDPAAGTTFWVAYGPLAGRFGIFQLHAAGHLLYTATRRLSTTGHTTFAYVAGQGTVKARFGLAPGNPVVTIHVFNQVPVTEVQLPLVRWQAPIG
jgi:hypothetical protein